MNSGNLTNSDPAPIVDDSAWAEFCDHLKTTGEVVLGKGAPTDPFNRAEGYRYLTRLLRAGLESNVEFSDPRFPVFFSLSHDTIKIGNDNPDNFYQNCNVSGQYDYLISGTRGTVDYLSLETKAGSYDTTGSMEPTGHVEADELEINDDGSFEIILSCKPHKGNWLPMTADTTSILVRQTFLNRLLETRAQLKIECLNGAGNNYLVPETFERQLLNAGQFVRSTATIFTDWMQIFSEHINALPSNDQSMCLKAGGDPSIHYMNSYWKLAPDEALLIEAKKIPSCKTWNFQLSNYWMESLDHRYYCIHTNKHKATYEKDGSVKIVIAHSDPGEAYPNWLTTAGHDQGAMLFRWVEADSHPPVDTRVVKFSEL